MVGLGGLAIAYLPAHHHLDYYLYHLQQYPLLNALVKAGIVFPLAFHYLGGLRHLAWDSIVGHNLQFVKQTGWGALAAAAVLTAIAMFTEFKPSKRRALH